MAKCRVFYKPDGSIDYMVLKEAARRPSETYDEHCKRVQATIPALAGLPYDDIDTADLPDRASRDRWRGSKGQRLRVEPVEV